MKRAVAGGGLVLMVLALGACNALAPVPKAREAQASAMPSRESTPTSATELPTPGSTTVSVTAIYQEKEVTVPLTPAVSMPEDPDLVGLVAQAVADLSQRLRIGADQIEVVKAGRVVWPDGALGCPQPGMVYTQALQAGALIRLAAEGQVYSYHSGGGRAPFLCEEPGPTAVIQGTSQSQRPSLASATAQPLGPRGSITASETLAPPIPTPTDTWLAGLVEEAKQDLAQRLSIDPGRIELVEAKGVLWPDGGFGCPQPGMAYIQVQRDGAFIQLRVGKRTYNYHSGYPGPAFLCEHPDTEFIP